MVLNHKQRIFNWIAPHQYQLLKIKYDYLGFCKYIDKVLLVADDSEWEIRERVRKSLGVGELEDSS
jgi:hypothetical protein